MFVKLYSETTYQFFSPLLLLYQDRVGEFSQKPRSFREALRAGQLESKLDQVQEMGFGKHGAPDPSMETCWNRFRWTMTTINPIKWKGIVVVPMGDTDVEWWLKPATGHESLNVHRFGPMDP